jgi:cytochrome c-type biogenesis protein CcmH
MTVFLIGAALMLAAALAFLLPPLLRKEQAVDHVQRDQLNLAVLRDQLRELEADREAGLIEQGAYESARHELERRVAEEVLPQEAVANATGSGKRWVAGAVGVAVPIIAISTYMLIGSPEAMDPAQQQVAAAHQQNSHEVTQEQIEGMVASLAARLKNEPDNIEGWHMLARLQRHRALQGCGRRLCKAGAAGAERFQPAGRLRRHAGHGPRPHARWRAGKAGCEGRTDRPAEHQGHCAVG